MNINALHGITANMTDGDDRIVTSIRQFAQDNGFSYTSYNKELVSHSWQNYKYAPAWLGMVALGISKSAHHIVSGTYKGYPIWMFTMRNDGLGALPVDELLGEGTSRQLNELIDKKYADEQLDIGIVRVRLPKFFPQILLDSSKNDKGKNGIKTSSIQTEYVSNQRMRLEGDFNDYFDLYAPVGLHVNVLTLLAPNMMQILKDYAGMIDVEFYGNEMILITHDAPYSTDTILALSGAIDEQLKYLDRIMPSWNYSPRTQPFDRLQKPIVTGGVIKVGKYRISSAMQLMAVAIFFVLFSLLIAILNMTNQGR